MTKKTIAKVTIAVTAIATVVYLIYKFRQPILSMKLFERFHR